MQVQAIVMITALQEGGKVKADQYWPDNENPVKNLGNGITLEYQTSSFQGDFVERTIKVVLPTGTSREVKQIQTQKWQDLSAPDKTKILRDMVHRVRENMIGHEKTPILVHCSAGVGRTGTFIAVYKLLDDYLDDR